MREDVVERLVLRLEERSTVLFSERREWSVPVLRFTERSEVRLVERSVTRLLRSAARWFMRVVRSVARLEVRLLVVFILVELS
jgi:hypothetical protein